jgi:hypothetical protein
MTKTFSSKKVVGKIVKSERATKDLFEIVEDSKIGTSTSSSPAATIRTSSVKPLVITQEAREKGMGILNGSEKPVVVYFPGSSGILTSDHSKMLDTLRDTFDIHVLIKPPESESSRLWAVAKVTSGKNITAATDFIKKVTTPGKEWCLMASSFGNRVAAELFNQERDHYLDDYMPSKFISIGIPMYADSKTRDVYERTDHFERCFPSQLRVLLISGSNDACLKSKAPADGPKGEALLQAQSQRWACKDNTQIHMVPGGSHGGIDGSVKPPAVVAVEKTIRSFLNP